MGAQIVILKNRFAEIAAKLTPAIARHIDETCNRIVVNAQGRAPVRTGDLRDSIVALGDPGSLERSVGTDVFYGKFQEFGTIHMAPHSFLGPALEDESGGLINSLLGLEGELA